MIRSDGCAASRWAWRFALTLLSANLSQAPLLAAPGDPAATGHFTILHVNDVYRIEGLEQGARGGFARLRTVRRDLEAQGEPLLMLHGGDFLFPSVIGKYLRGRPMIDAMNRLDGDENAFDPRLFTTFGNHEFDDKDPGVVLGGWRSRTSPGCPRTSSTRRPRARRRSPSPSAFAAPPSSP